MTMKGSKSVFLDGKTKIDFDKCGLIVKDYGETNGRKWRVIICHLCKLPGKVWADEVTGFFPRGYKYPHPECKKAARSITMRAVIRRQKEMRYGRKFTEEEIDFPFCHKPTCPEDRKEIHLIDPIIMPVKKKRICLMCDKTFFSQGAHNRICEPCKKIQPRDDKCRKTFFKASNNRVTDAILIHDFYNYKVGWITNTIEPIPTKKAEEGNNAKPLL